MIEAAAARHAILYKNPYSYCAHPHVARAGNGDLLVVFNRAPRRACVLHPPEEPLFHNLLMRSSDDGVTWSMPEVVPSYDFHGTECAGLTVLRSGVVLLNQWRFRWLPLGLARSLQGTMAIAFPETFMRGWLNSPEHDTGPWRTLAPEQIAPYARGPGETWVHLSNDHGQSFLRSVRLDTHPFSGGYGMRGACELCSGDVVLPLSDIPQWRIVFAVRSRDGGLTWEAPVKVAEQAGSEFEEPTLIETRPGQLLMILRDNGSRRLHQVTSEDAGATWSAPRDLGIEGYPGQLLRLADGRILLTYGWRYPDYGVRAVLSDDDGRTWSLETVIRIRGGLPSKNLGYPATIAALGGGLISVYYGEDGDGVTCIMSTRWRAPV